MRRIDHYTQREFVDIARVVIDHAIKVDTKAAWAKVVRLIDNNPNAYASTYARHNLGKTRRAWADDASRRAHSRAGLPVRPVARSSSAFSNQQIRAMVADTVARYGEVLDALGDD